MTVGIGHIVREGPEREGVFVEVISIPQQGQYEIAASYVMNQVAEVLAPEWVVAEVLDDAAAIGVCVCFDNVIISRIGESTTQERLDSVSPYQIDDLLMGEYGITGHQMGSEQDEQKY